jgi:hypothetical protein
MTNDNDHSPDRDPELDAFYDIVEAWVRGEDVSEVWHPYFGEKVSA